MCGAVCSFSACLLRCLCDGLLQIRPEPDRELLHTLHRGVGLVLELSGQEGRVRSHRVGGTEWFCDEAV